MLPKVLPDISLWYSESKLLHHLEDKDAVSALVLCDTCCVFIEQAEKNGDDGEPKAAAAVSRLRLFVKNSNEDINTSGNVIKYWRTFFFKSYY